MRIQHAGEARARKTAGRYDGQNRRIVTPLNEKRVHAWLAYDLFTLDLLRCKPISQQRRTRPLASIETRLVRIANEETQPMNTEAH